MLRKLIVGFVLAVVLSSCGDGSDAEGAAELLDDPEDTAVEADEERPTGGVVAIESTGADTLRDLVRPGDPAPAYCLADLGVAPGEFYDKATDSLLFPETTYYFEARYADGATVEIRMHPDIVDGNAAAQADRIAEPISLLPVELRANIQRVGFLGGNFTAQGDGGGEGIHVYEENVFVREAAGRFEETMFHESVHTSLDDDYAASSEWLAAQESDGTFLTEYGASLPAQEDLAETALYAWALMHHPDRISEADAEAWEAAVPARIDVIETILSAPGEGFSASDPSC